MRFSFGCIGNNEIRGYSQIWIEMYYFTLVLTGDKEFPCPSLKQNITKKAILV